MSEGQWDAIVIGAGAAGAVFAHELTHAGLKVLMLEQGKRYAAHREQFVENELSMWERTWDNGSYETEGDGFTGAPNLGLGVGGGTLVWTAVSLRFFAHDFRMRSNYGRPTGTSVADWPLDLNELEPYYDKAERQMGVSGGRMPWDESPRRPPPNPAFGYYRSGVLLERGMDRLGIRSAPGPVAINSRRYRDRERCLHCGFCRAGCRVDAKYQADTVLIEPALRTGRLKLETGVTVTRIESDAGDRVRGVRYRDLATGAEYRASAKICIAANNPIEIPRLLLNSASELHPYGLGNRHDQIGRNFFCHPSILALGTTDECVNASVGYNMGNILTLDFCRTEATRTYVGGFSFQSLNGAGAGVMAVDPYRDLWGAELKHAMSAYNNSLFTITFCEGMPVYDNRVSIDPARTDRFGNPVAKIRYTLHDNDRKLYADALAKTQSILQAAGAGQVYHNTAPFEAHPAGTLRMGHSPRESATDAYGRVHGLTNLFVGGGALFVTGSSVNPTLTLHALALRTAAFIKANFSALQ